MLTALDSRTSKIVWEKRLPYPSCGGSGTMVTTTGLLFHGEPDGNLQAYDANSGERQCQFQIGPLGPWSAALGPGTGPVVAYQVDNEEYVAFAIDRSIWAFKLGGTVAARSAPPSLPVEEPFRGAVRDTDAVSIGGPMGEKNAKIGREFEWFSEHTLNPNRVQVKVGTTLTWTNTGKLSHNISARDGSWTTGPISAGKAGRVTFTKAGAYTYICADHPWAIGQVIVEP